MKNFARHLHAPFNSLCISTDQINCGKGRLSAVIKTPEINRKETLISFFFCLEKYILKKCDLSSFLSTVA